MTSSMRSFRRYRGNFHVHSVLILRPAFWSEQLAAEVRLPTDPLWMCTDMAQVGRLDSRDGSCMYRK